MLRTKGLTVKGMVVKGLSCVAGAFGRVAHGWLERMPLRGLLEQNKVTIPGLSSRAGLEPISLKRRTRL